MREPQCPYFGECGGCSAQHIPYELQLENKKKLIAQAIKYEDVHAFSGSEYNYRNRMDFIFHPGGLGLRKKGKWQHIVNVEQCAISDERVNHLLAEIRAFFKGADYFDIYKKKGTFRYAVIRISKGETTVSFMLNEDSQKLQEAVEQIKQFARQTTAGHILIAYTPAKTDESTSQEYYAVKGNELMKEGLLGKVFYYSPEGFFQNNTFMAEKMLHYVHELLQRHDTKNAHLLDLYCGVGTFGIVNAALFKETTLIESVPSCIEAANKNIEENKIKNTKAILLDAMQLKKVELGKPLFVITDPPRTGMHPKTIQRLNELEPEVIIYISCNVQQLTKELPRLKEYVIKSAAMFDLFPQTPHVEAIVELVRIKI
ncbi:MAG TPA: 23S rRNA (uracil(1939)-C(5))-methyltransferase RlmD [Candidatus Nanoarchaeia archaeon]|nr:23S rRNA (uracil(1939)-C(5))-methyltransferase RlmD [Candidatus Nanoarchaeia archaeon]